MSEPPASQSSLQSEGGAGPHGPSPALMGWVLALRWPIAVVAAVGIGAVSLGRILQEPIKIELVMKSPLPVSGQVDLGSIQSPLVVEEITAPIRTAPIKTIPITAKVTVAEPIAVASPLAVNVPELGRGIGVAVRGPVEATVNTPVTAEVRGTVNAQVAGDVGATVRGDVGATVQGKVEANVINQLEHRRIRIGF
ncbi:hypothetical protein KBZ18_15270 [Synechococcus sp. Cruz-9H2]|uniref:hypothetical protein n=1 Tax=unclassified Synechococcus TaxID=2626047 RepID=UPI0020CBC0A1|nr:MULTISPECIES: hypothetical protein [unclassified Synechococcus]MCP9820844.1 hypothetical protein [Synechococcus sp. Cruz-9H2]MCP9845084.1 hypothetical protein [Synechococcus sp. Edmonson 11F2]MCP9857200.1 hypothetical protein [Synechococcus sp. Cruz-9C9]MCP9864485.1 hypothetical protein [Synechococcus sp. Cruz-7E5]MCP9871754.1 hypothetical protein [Synechococcus sp. Cruz-7B9]